MKRLLLSCVFAVMLSQIFCAAIATKEDESGKQTKGQQLQVVEEAESLHIEPSVIYVDMQHPTEVTVTSSVGLQCTIFPTKDLELGATGTPPCDRGLESENPMLEFTNRQKTKTGQVQILLVSAPAHRSALSWVALGLAMLMAGISFAQFRQYRSEIASADKEKKVLADELSSIQSKIEMLESNLRKAFVSSASDRVTSSTTNMRDSTANGVLAGRRPLFAQFVKDAEAWCKIATDNLKDVPFDVRNGLEEIRSLSPQPGLGDDLLGRFQKYATKVARVALMHSDERFDPLFANQPLQETIRRLVNAAGLTLIQPRTGERFNHDVHQPVGQEPADSSQRHGLIAAVVRRGLRNDQSVICKAEVRVYD